MAAKFLEKKGYEIVERNWYNRYGEIDLVCRQGEETVFVEVKTMAGDSFGSPEDKIDKNKMKRLAKNAIACAAIKKIDIYRIDAVCITLDEVSNEAKTINHYENITI